MSAGTQEATQSLNEEEPPSSPPQSPGAPQPWGLAVATRAGVPNAILVEREVLFGRRSKCQVRHEEPTVSGVHFRLEFRDGSVWCTDSSTNGTYLGSQRMEKGKPVIVTHGTEISLAPPHGKHRRLSYIIYVHSQAPKGADYDSSTIEGLYDFREELGRGAFATVFLAIHRRTGERVAIKRMDKAKLAANLQSDRPGVEEAEVDILTRLDHPNIIKVIDVRDTATHLYIVLELVCGGDLFDQLIGVGRPYPEPRARNIMRQIVGAVKYLHDQRIVHRDLKPENVLLKTAVPLNERRHDRDVVKVADFGFSRFVGETSFMTTLCGTPMYIAPEVLRPLPGHEGYGPAADMWSCGVILFILLSARPPFDDNKSLADQVLRNAPIYDRASWATVSAEARDLVRRLMTTDPRERLDAEQCLAHPWMAGAPAAPPAAAGPSAAEVAAAVAAESSPKNRKRKAAGQKAAAPAAAAPAQPKKDKVPLRRIGSGAGMSQVYGIFDDMDINEAASGDDEESDDGDIELRDAAGAAGAPPAKRARG